MRRNILRGLLALLAAGLAAFPVTVENCGPAVRNGRLYPVPNIITESSVRIVDGLELIARDLHPQAFEQN